MGQTFKPRRPYPWRGPMGGVNCDFEEDGSRTVHVRIPHAILTSKECRIMASWMTKAAGWIEQQREAAR